MCTETCGYVLPDNRLAWPPENPECVLREGHAGDHLARFSDGQYLAWSRELGCGCLPEEVENGMCECFTYSELSEEEAREFFKKEGPE